jgi:hypothetical protein
MHQARDEKAILSGHKIRKLIVNRILISGRKKQHFKWIPKEWIHIVVQEIRRLTTLQHLLVKHKQFLSESRI